VTVYEWVRILDPERLSVGSHVIVDDFVLIDAGEGSTLGSHVHIASFVSMTGGGRFEIGDFAGVATGCRLLAARTCSTAPGSPGRRSPTAGGRSSAASFGSGVTRCSEQTWLYILGLAWGEGAIVGSNSLVARDIPPWTIDEGENRGPDIGPEQIP